LLDDVCVCVCVCVCFWCTAAPTRCVDILASYLATAPTSSSDSVSVTVNASTIELCRSECLGRDATQCMAVMWHFAVNVPSNRRCVLYTQPVTDVIKGNNVAAMLSVRQTCFAPVVLATTR